MSQNHACSPKAIYLEMTGQHDDNHQNEYWLYQGDNAVELLAEGDASEGRFGPIVESQKEFFEEELADYRLVQKIGDIEVPLLQVEEVSQCGLIPKQRAFQHNLMVSTVPMLYLDHQELASGPCRGGFIYVFLNGRLIRELVVSGEPSQAPRFIDSDIATYRQQGDEVPAVREFTGPALSHLHLPLKLDGEAADVSLAFSDHPWPWAHIQQLEANPSLIEKRCQPLALNESSVSAMLQSDMRNMYTHSVEVNRDECAGKASLDWLPPMRPRDVMYEQAWGSARDYLEDTSAEGWNTLVEQLRAEREFFESDDQQATPPESDIQTRQRYFSPALRSCLVQQWNNACRADDERADDASLAMLPAPEGTDDCLAALRAQQLCAVFLRDPKQAIDHLIEDIQAGQELLWVLSEGMKYHPHGKSAELIQANCFMPHGPSGEENPLYLDTWYDTRLERSRESLFARLIKEEERRLARLRIDERLSALVTLFNDTSPGAFCHTLRDAMLFDDINHLEPYTLLARCIETLQIGLNCLDFKATPDEAQTLQAPAQCQQALEALFASNQQQAGHACSPLLFAEESCSTNLWGSPYARNLDVLQVAAKNVMDQQDKVATPTGEQLIAWQQRLDEEVGDLGPAMSSARMALNGTDAVASSIVPTLLNAVAGLKLGETMTITLASDIADLKGALMGGLPIEVADVDGTVHWLLPSQFKPLTEEMAQGGIALQAASARNVLGGEVTSSPSATSRAQVTGQVTSEQAFRWTQTGYIGLWSGLVVLEAFNLVSAIDDALEKGSIENLLKAASSTIDASLLTLQGLKLSNVRWGWAVRANEFLDIRLIKNAGWQEAMGEAGQVRGFMTLSAGFFTASLVAIDAYQLYQQGLRDSAKWTAGASGAIGVGSYVGSGYGQGMANAARMNLVRNRFLNGLLGLVGTPRPVPVMLVSLGVALVCQYMATNARDDRLSLWVRYGPFGNHQDELAGKLQSLAEEAEDDARQMDKHDYLKDLQSASSEGAYFQLLQGLFQVRFALVAPQGLVDIDPDFLDCDIAIRMTCPGLRYGEFQLPITQIEAACSAPVPDRRHTYQYAPMDRRRLLVELLRQDPDDPTVRYLGIRIPREWRRLGVPTTGLGDVPAKWLAASYDQFRHEPDYQREYHQGSYLVRIGLGDIEGQGSVEYWDPVERQHRKLEDSVAFAAQPSTLTWVWNKQGAGV
ncbi:hypothetical protein QEN58_16200 [Halomonas alkaliantarctica]|uniref:Uncharacterized protein n=1 Tax=Halomonas alkaliantarctica TaxID=232346 RepID=A0ABY8LK94_9GAMM|nr:hypothetical protein [Halomonas alkaliantarctica]WGI24851.1 hypothetical protein QEN58_16200 [Halomonas alkaliantarctica]